MYGAAIPDDSAGSNHVGASEMCTPHVIWSPWPRAPVGAVTNAKVMTTRVRTITRRGRGIWQTSLRPGRWSDSTLLRRVIKTDCAANFDDHVLWPSGGPTEK